MALVTGRCSDKWLALLLSIKGCSYVAGSNDFIDEDYTHFRISTCFSRKSEDWGGERLGERLDNEVALV